MAKIYGLFGSMTGKLADTVMSVRNGEQLARKYQPVVFNPSTPAQVAQRAKLKLLSQMSAVMANYLAIPREGSVSSRNLFTKKNFPNVTYADNTAAATLVDIQLTKSELGLPAVTATRDGGNLAVTLAEGISDIDRVVYVAFRRTSDNKLLYNGGTVVSTPGEGNTWPATLLTDAAGDMVVYAYGVRDNDAAARIAFGDLEVATPVSVANLVTSRTVPAGSITTTETRGVLVTIA